MDAFQQLIEYPVKHGLEYDTQESHRRFFLSQNDPMGNTKFVLFRSGALFFYAYDTYSTKVSSTNTFSGLYGVTNRNYPDLKVYKKDFTDTFLRTSKRKTGFDHIDRQLTITSGSSDLSSFHLSPDAVRLFLDLEKKFRPLHLLVQNDYLPNIGELKGKKVIGLQTEQWLYREEDLEVFIRLGEELIGSI